MLAAVLTTLNAPLTLAEVQPCALDYGQVLVRVLVSGICGAQLQEIAGHKGNSKFLPHLLGHEGCAIVEEVGVGVTHVKKGDKAVLHWRKGAGIESPFPKYIYEGREINSGRVTTFSEYAICSENRLTSVPSDLPADFCALLGCGLSTALATVEQDAAIKFGEGVMIVGMGGLGVNLLRAARLANASPIICVDVHEAKRETADLMGATGFINSAEESIADGLKRIGCGCCDVILDTAGSSKSIEGTLPHLAPSGRFVMIGQPRPGESVTIANANHLFGGEGKSIRATQGGGFNPTVDIPRYVRLYEAGLLNLDNLITHRVSLANINKGLDLVRGGFASRVIVDMQKAGDAVETDGWMPRSEPPKFSDPSEIFEVLCPSYEYKKIRQMTGQFFETTTDATHWRRLKATNQKSP